MHQSGNIAFCAPTNLLIIVGCDLQLQESHTVPLDGFIICDPPPSEAPQRINWVHVAWKVTEEMDDGDCFISFLLVLPAGSCLVDEAVCCLHLSFSNLQANESTQLAWCARCCAVGEASNQSFSPQKCCWQWIEPECYRSTYEWCAR